jgi:hypothetical protein
VEAPDELITIVDFLRDDIGVKGRTVVDKEFPVAIENHSPERRHVLEAYPVVLGLDPVGRALNDLEKPQSQQEHGKNGDHKEGEFAQPLS